MTIYSRILSILVIVSLSISCSKNNNNKIKNEKATEIKGYVEYLKKIKENSDGNNYYAGYKEVELRKMLNNRSSFQKNITAEDESNFSSSAAQSATFTERGPQNASGRTRAFIIDKADASGNTYLAASIGGGIWRGVYNPVSMEMAWSNLTPDIENLDFVSMAQSSNNPSVIYAGTGERSLSGEDNGSGIYKSSDGGATWANITPKIGLKIDPSFANVYRIIVDPNDENIVVIAAERKYYSYSKIFRSTDGGSSWNKVYEPAGTSAITQVIASPSDFNIQYAAVRGGNALRSDDAGLTWRELGDFQGTWSYHSRNELVVSHQSTEIIYAGLKVGGSSTPFGLNVSYDGGTNWHHVVENDKFGNTDYIDDGWIGQQGNYNNFIQINPYNDKIVYVGDINIHKFTILDDTTKSSQAITDVYSEIDSDGVGKINGYVHPDQHTMTTFSDGLGNFRLIVGNDGGPAISDMSPDPGVNDKSWQATEFMWAWTPSGSGKPQIDIGYRTTQFYHAAKVKGKNQYIGGTQDNGTYLTREPSVSTPQEADRVGSGDGFGVITHWDDPLKMMLTCQYNGCAAITKDGGAFGPWSFEYTYGFKQDESEGNPFYSKLANSKQDPDMIYGITTNGVIRSDNFGDSWTYNKLKGSSTIHDYYGSDIEVSEANPRFVWAGGWVSEDYNESIFLSKDWGQTFEPVKIPKGVSANTSGIFSHPTEDSTVYILFSNYGRSKIYETKDLGVSWNDITGFSPNFQFSEDDSSTGFPNVGVNALVVMPYDSDIIWAGTEIGLVETRDRGQTWTLTETNLPYVNIYDLELADQGQVVIATYGRGIWTANVPDLVSWVPKESAISLSLEKNSISENDESTKVNIQLSRDLSPYSPAKIVFSASGTATSADYILSSDTMVITNQSIPDFYITSIQDTEMEGDETLSLSVSYIENGKVISGDKLDIVIKDDDTNNSPPSLSFDVDKTTIDEDSDEAKITVSLSKEPNLGPVSIKFKFDGTAESTDYTTSTEEIIISSGKSAEMVIASIQDTEDESNEEIIVVVESAENVSGTWDNVTISTIVILDDDEPAPLSVENSFDEIFEIYPNPTEGILKIKSNRSFSDGLEIKIFDIFGREFINKKISGDIKLHTFDLRNRDDGLYIIRVLSGDKVYSKKIIKK
tara:strand:- start:647 stop:4108 length:3462 start_codon:yes stop_codon:yes gene_type:complete